MSRISDLIVGSKHLAKGFVFLFAHPSLWPWALIPTILNLLLLVVTLAFFIGYYGDIYSWLALHLGIANVSQQVELSAYTFVIVAARIIVQMLLVILSLILIFIVAYCAGLVIASPFNDALSERVEIIKDGFSPSPFSFMRFISETMRVAKVETLKAFLLFVIPIALLILNIIPIVGGFLYIIFTFLFGSLSFGFSYADLPATRRALSFKERLIFIRRNKWALIGFGIGFIIPFFGLVFSAPMVVGGTLLYIELERRT